MPEPGIAHHPPPENNAQVDSGSYMPFQPFGMMVGCPLNGTWNFQVCDYWGSDNGWVFWWQLNLNANILPINWGYSVPIDTITWIGPYITLIPVLSLPYIPIPVVFLITRSLLLMNLAVPMIL